MTLNGAIERAFKHAPVLREAQSDQDAAEARVRQAQAGALPSVTVSGGGSDGSTDFGQFFGLGRKNMRSRTAQLQVRQTIFAGGAVRSAIGQARAGDAAAKAQLNAARLTLVTEVVQAFVAVRRGEQVLILRQRQLDELALIVDQSGLRFRAGDASSTDVERSRARMAEAKAEWARSQGDLARTRAHFQTLVGEAPDGLEPPGTPPETPATLDDATALARAHNPDLIAAGAALRAAESGVGLARADMAPSIALVAEASSVRDQFLPGYRADGAAIGVQGRWVLFSGGLASGKVSEAQAQRRKAQAALDQARDAADEAVIDAWQAQLTAQAVAVAAQDRAAAADAALADVRNEVRVGAKPVLDLLDAEREALAARIAAFDGQADRIVAAYRLNAVVGR